MSKHDGPIPCVFNCGRDADFRIGIGFCVCSTCTATVRAIMKGIDSPDKRLK